MEKTLDSLLKLLQWLNEVFGPWGVVGIPVVLVLLLGVVIWLRSRETNLVIQEKERTIQRLASDNRELRIVQYREVFGWSEAEVDRAILRNEPVNGAEARKALEGGGEGSPPAKGFPVPSRKRKR